MSTNSQGLKIAVGLQGHIDQCLSQDLDTGCLKLAVVKFLGIQMRDHIILIFQSHFPENLLFGNKIFNEEFSIMTFWGNIHIFSYQTHLQLHG